MPENFNEDFLIIQVWHFDPTKTIGEKMSNLRELKGKKGFSRLMKEIAANLGKSEQELIGSIKVPLKNISMDGVVMWYNLEKNKKDRGTIKLRLNASFNRNGKA